VLDILPNSDRLVAILADDSFSLAPLRRAEDQGGDRSPQNLPALIRRGFAPFRPACVGNEGFDDVIRTERGVLCHEKRATDLILSRLL